MNSEALTLGFSRIDRLVYYKGQNDQRYFVIDSLLYAVESSMGDEQVPPLVAFSNFHP